MNEQITSLKRQLEAELKRANEFVDAEASQVIRIFDNLMIYGVSRIINCKYALQLLEENDEVFLSEVKEKLKEYKRFSIEADSEGLTIAVGGYWRGSIKLQNARKYWLEIDEDFSIKKYREFIKSIKNI
jgi:hypothetical protein